MKACFFSNQYVSGVATGIQAGHAIDNMWSYYTEDHHYFEHTATFNMLREFSREHKTFIILNGGDHNRLQDMVTFLSYATGSGANLYPWRFAVEPGLNNAITSVGIILPDFYFGKLAEQIGYQVLDRGVEACRLSPNFAESIRGTGLEKATDFDLELLARKAPCKLAV